MPKPDYSSEEWADVIPIPQNDGGPNPIAAIAYSDEYSEAMDYLRAVMAANEKSERVLKLTEHIIKMNPAHYTVWVYRAAVLDALGVRPEEELAFLTSISMKYLKNYQIWHHRQVIISKLSTMPETEPDFLAVVLAKDVKNYHVWSYRQWLVSHFGLWADQTKEDNASVHPAGQNGELQYVERLIEEDVRNNSAWHHRYFVIFDKPNREKVHPVVIRREIEYSKAAIRIAPQNQSAWNYLQGVVKRSDLLSGTQEYRKELENFALQYADPDKPDELRSTFALDLLANKWVTEQENEKAARALDLLADVYDPIRKKYWIWRKAQLEHVATESTASKVAVN